MKIFVTNLPSSTKRKQFMLNQLNGKNLDYEFIDCVVGKDLTEAEINEACDVDKIHETNKNVEWLNKGMIGCTMTSKKIHSEIVNRNLDCALLLEDDVVLPDNFKEILDEYEKIIKQGNVILLFWLGHGEIKLLEKSKICLENTTLYETKDNHLLTGGSCTVITREAARKMLEINTPIHTSPDSWGYFLSENCINKILCSYPAAVDTADFPSTMELGKFIKLRKILSQIFPFSYILKRRRNKFKKNQMKIKILT